MSKPLSFVLLSFLAGTAVADSVNPTCFAIERSFAENKLDALHAVDAAQPRWEALKQFRLAAAYIPADERKPALKAIREGLSVVSRELKTHPEDPELLILGAMLDGQYLLLQPWRFFWNGRRGLKRIARAEKFEPENPRIALVRGTAKFILPRILGGSAQEAEAIFSTALNQPTATNTPFQATNVCAGGQWGQVDLMNWLARAYAKQGKDALSQDTFQLASKYSPGNHWVDLALKGEGYEWTQE